MSRGAVPKDLFAIVYKAYPDTFVPVVFDGKVAEITGHSAEDFLSGHVKWADLVHPDDRGDFNTHIRENAAFPGLTTSHDYRLTAKDGSIRRVRVLCVSEAGSGGKPATLMGTIYDVTNEKNAEIELKESRELFRTIFNSSPIPSYMVGLADRKIVMVNSAFESVFGFTQEEVIGQFPVELGFFGEEPENTAVCKRLVEEGKLRDFEYIFNTKSGEVRTGIAYCKVIEMQGVPCVLVETIDITDRKKAESALLESATNLRKTQEIARLGSWHYNMKGSLTWSAQSYNNLGVSPDSFTPTAASFMELIHSGDREAMREWIRACKAAENPGELEFRCVHPDGSIHWLGVRGELVCDADGKPLYMAGTNLDITRRKQAEEKLNENIERMRLIIKGSNVGLWDWDLRTNKVYYSPEWKSQIGYEEHEISDSFDEWQSRVHPDDLEPTLKSFNDFIASQRPYNEVEFRFRHKDGSYRWIFSSSSFIYGDNDKPVRMIGTHLDITDRKNAEIALRESRVHLSNALRIAKVGHWEHDYINNVFRFTDEFYELMHTNAIEMGGYEIPPERYVELFMDPRDAHMVADEIKKAIETTDPNYSARLEHRVKFADGTAGHVAVRFQVVKDEQGRTIKTIGANQDITERKLAEMEIAQLREEFAQAQKMESVGRLAGGVAHDMNNMLTIILGYSEMLMEALKQSSSELYEQAGEIYKAGKRAQGIVRQLLAFSRKQVLQVNVFEINELISDFQKLLGRLIGEDIELKLMLGADAGKVEADPSQIEQVILNLAVNARDAMPTGGTLVIETASEHFDQSYASMRPEMNAGDYVCISVSDTGTGMDPDTASKIFEPFFTTKGLGMGTGLGLSTVYGIVKQHGGHIYVYSEPGIGTTFKVYLPKAGSPEVKSESAHEAAAGGGHETILIVEDDESVRRLAERFLGPAGYRVLSAHDIETAKQLAQRAGQIHLLLTDVVMPGKGGRQVYEVLQAAIPELKVVYMSGYTDEIVSKHGILKKGVFFVQKPFTSQALLSKVREALDA
ncbi:MAG: PAS domain-containing protein [bacterium]|jgi:PAS domain S-box-containing protein